MPHALQVRVEFTALFTPFQFSQRVGIPFPKKCQLTSLIIWQAPGVNPKVCDEAKRLSPWSGISPQGVAGEFQDPARTGANLFLLQLRVEVVSHLQGFKYLLPFFIQKTVKQDFPRTFGWNLDGICYSNLNSTNDPIRWLFVCPSGLPDWDRCPSCRSRSESVFRCRKWRMRPVKIIMGFCTSQCSMILRVCYLSICFVLFYCPQKAWSIWEKCQQCHPCNPLSAEPRPCVSAFDHTNWWVPFPKATPEYLFELDSVQYFDHKLYVQICENHSGNLWISELIFLGQRTFGNLLHQSSKKNLVPLYFCAGLSVVDDTKVNLRKRESPQVQVDKSEDQ